MNTILTIGSIIGIVVFLLYNVPNIIMLGDRYGDRYDDWVDKKLAEKRRRLRDKNRSNQYNS